MSVATEIRRHAKDHGFKIFQVIHDGKHLTEEEVEKVTLPTTFKIVSLESKHQQDAFRLLIQRKECK